MDTFDHLKTVPTGRPVQIIAFHGSEALFDEFQLSKKENSPGIWFSIDQDYVTCMGEYIYECEITLKNPVRGEDLDFDIPTRSEIVNQGHDGIIMQFADEPENGVPRDVFIIATQPENIKILTRKSKFELGEAKLDQDTVFQLRI